MQNVPFVAFLNTAALPHRRLASSWTSRFTRRARGQDKTDILAFLLVAPLQNNEVLYISGWSCDLGLKSFDYRDRGFESC